MQAQRNSEEPIGNCERAHTCLMCLRAMIFIPWADGREVRELISFTSITHRILTPDHCPTPSLLIRSADVHANVIGRSEFMLLEIRMNKRLLTRLNTKYPTMPTGALLSYRPYLSGARSGWTWRPIVRAMLTSLPICEGGSQDTPLTSLPLSQNTANSTPSTMAARRPMIRVVIARMRTIRIRL
ncbi:hypothetical protein EDB19DRAFT_1716053 [Suillus lakei]|nr:hypothetical protein EDB19DRAFT_1716053 [Suillus lakei]